MDTEFNKGEHPQIRSVYEPRRSDQPPTHVDMFGFNKLVCHQGTLLTVLQRGPAANCCTAQRG